MIAQDSGNRGDESRTAGTPVPSRGHTRRSAALDHLHRGSVNRLLVWQAEPLRCHHLRINPNPKPTADADTRARRLGVYSGHHQVADWREQTVAATHTPQADKIPLAPRQPPRRRRLAVRRVPHRRRPRHHLQAAGRRSGGGARPRRVGRRRLLGVRRRQQDTARHHGLSRHRPRPSRLQPFRKSHMWSFSRQAADHRWEAAVGPTFGCGRPKCRIFVSHALVGRSLKTTSPPTRPDRRPPSMTTPASTLVRASRTKCRGAPGSDHRPVLESINV